MTAERKKPSSASGLGFRLGTTLVLALLPLGVLSVVQTWASLDQVEQTTLDGIGGASLEAVRPQIDLIRDAQATARVLAAAQSANPVDAADCSSRMAAVAATIPQATLVALVPASGRITCASTLGMGPGENGDLSADPMLLALASQPEPALAYGAKGPVAGLPVIVVSAPVRSSQGGQAGAIGILITHQSVAPRAYQSDYGLWQPALMATFTGNGALLAADLDPAQMTGLLPPQVALENLASLSGAPFFYTDSEGIRRIYSITTVADDLFLLAVWQQDAGAGGWATSQMTAFLLPVLTWAAALLAASFASNRLVVRHVRALSRSMAAYMSNRARLAVPAIAEAPTEIQSLHAAYEELIRAIEHDEAELENLLVDKDRLLREVHHRSGNSLQIISSVMRVYRRESNDPALRGVLDGLINRVIALSTTHTSLYGLDGRHDVPMDEVLNAVILRLKEIHGVAVGSARKRLEPILLPAETAIPLALALAETVSCFFAARTGMDGGIEVALTGAGDDICLSVEGPVVPEFQPETTHGLAALPRRMLTQFAGQLRGRVTTRVDGCRSFVELVFPRTIT